MTDAELIEFTTAFRESILDGRPSKWMCFMVCAPLAALLAMHGVHVETVETDLGDFNHFWLRLPSGHALDPTADQFNELFNLSLPPVYLGEPTTIHGRS